MRVMNFYRCPYLEECTGKAVQYYDKGTEFYLQGIDCRGAFLTDAKGDPVCMLSIPADRVRDFPAKFEKIHRANEKRIEAVKALAALLVTDPQSKEQTEWNNAIAQAICAVEGAK